MFQNQFSQIIFHIPRIVVKQGIACCCASITDENEEIIDGIITGHAYVVVETLTLNGGPSDGTNLIKLFNPWGEGEWEHEWADDSGHFAYICSFSPHGGLPNKTHLNTSSKPSNRKAIKTT